MIVFHVRKILIKFLLKNEKCSGLYGVLNSILGNIFFKNVQVRSRFVNCRPGRKPKISNTNPLELINPVAKWSQDKAIFSVMALCHLSTLPHLVIMWIFLEQCYKIIPILRSSELTDRNSELECRNLLYFQMSSFPQGPIWNWYIFINDMDSETEFPNSASLQMTPK